MITKQSRSKSGMALLLALLALIIILAAVTLVSNTVQRSGKETDMALAQTQLDETCKAGVDIGVDRIWNQYKVSNGNTTGNLASYRVFLDAILPCGADTNGDSVPDSAAAPLALITASEPQLLGPDSVPEAQRPRVTDLTIDRKDDADGIFLTLAATANVGGRERSATQSIRVSGKPFSGYNYAVLAKNINCILCHAGFYDLGQKTNTDATAYNSFDRLKVASLQSLLYRSTTADSKVSGTVYTRGQVYETTGALMSAATIQGSDFKGFGFNQTNGKILQNAGTGSMTVAPLVNATMGDDGKLHQFANLYTNYPTDAAQMTDGDLPDTFPAPYPDDDGDRIIDSTEFEQVAQTLSGAVTGGVVYGVPDGQSYASTTLPAASNDAQQALATGAYNGNVILVGTDANPIQLNGDVVVNGDLVMRGKVKGWGQVFVRGNTYLVGDVTYADAAGKFGEASDGTKNGMAIVTGGSVLMGDYLTIRGKSHTADTAKYPDSSFSIDSRTQNRSRTKTIGGVTQTLNYGYFDPGVVDAGQIQTPRQGQQFSFTASELMLFNKLEADKAGTDPTYVPRFYGLRSTQPNNIYVYNKAMEEHAVRYDETGGGVKTLSQYLTSQGYSQDIMNRGAYHYMSPKNNWISEDALRQVWYNDEMGRAAHDIWDFDGLLYSNNAIFALTRSMARHKSNTDGKMRIRGAIICPDLGVLCAGPDVAGTESFTLLYDQRVQKFWAPQDTTQVTLARVVFAPQA